MTLSNNICNKEWNSVKRIENVLYQIQNTQ